MRDHAAKRPPKAGFRAGRIRNETIGCGEPGKLPPKGTIDMDNHSASAKPRRLTRITASLLAGVFALTFAPQLVAAAGGGGGGGTGGGNPSSSAPRKQVDPAESFRQGYEAYETGNYKKAEKKFREVLSVAKKHPETNFYMGMTKLKRGKAKSSRRYFERAVKERPTYVEAREQLALVYVELDRRVQR